MEQFFSNVAPLNCFSSPYSWAMNDQPTDLLIIGAGPTGLAAGIDALRHGLSVRLIERKRERSLESKALVVHARTMEVLETLGCAEEVRRAGQIFKALNVRPDPTAAPVRIDLLNRPWGDTKYPYWLSTPQYDVERALEERFRALGGIVEWGTSLERLEQDDEGVNAITSAGPHRARYLLACDGGRSTAREAVGLELPRSGLGVTFALTDVRTSGSLPEDEGHGVLSKEGLLLVVPMPEPSVWRLIAHVDASFDSTSLDAWRGVVQRRSGFPLELHSLGWNSRFDLTSGVAPRFRKGRVFLLGDAAHVHSPVGGQGLNTGVQDAHQLVWKLALVLRRTLSEASREALLDSYEAERRPIATQMVRMTSLATRVLTLENPLARKVRALVGSRVVRTARFQNALSRRVGMLEVESEGARRLENPEVSNGKRLHDFVDPLVPTVLRWNQTERVVRPDRIIANAALLPQGITTATVEAR